MKYIHPSQRGLVAAVLLALNMAWPALPVFFALAAPAAHAIVGAPATPVSVAGVARRTTRRTVAAGAVAAPVTTAAVVGATTAVTVGATVAALPPTGCTVVVTAGVTYQNCSGVYYRPAYQGTNVVYVVSSPP